MLIYVSSPFSCGKHNLCVCFPCQSAETVQKHVWIFLSRNYHFLIQTAAIVQKERKVKLFSQTAINVLNINFHKRSSE